MTSQNEQHESKESFHHLEVCCRYVGEKYGKPEIGSWTNGDYVRLSGILSRQTAIQISASTLKRIFGKLKTTDRYYPQKATRDALARYAGYLGWEDLVQRHPRPQKAEKPGNLTAGPNVEEQAARPSIQLPRRSAAKWVVLLIIPVFVIVGVIVWPMITKEKPAPVTKIDAELICNNPEGENPHSAVFKLQLAKGFALDKSKFSIDFGDGRPERNIYPGVLVTHYYEVPGRFYPVLKYDGKSMDTVSIYLKTNGWTATANMESDTVRVYPVNQELFKNGQLIVTPRELFHAGVDTNRTFFVDFVNTKPLAINGDNFELLSTIQTSLSRPGVRCSQISITLFGEKSNHSVMVIRPGCVSWAYLQFSEILKDGQRDDLSSIGADLSNGGTVKLQVINKKVKLIINDQKVYETSYEFPLKKIYGIEVSFAGIGLVKDLVVKDLGTGEIFEEGFK